MTKVILGLGKTGISVAEFFTKKKIPFSICDSRDAPPLLNDFQKKFPDTKVYTGGFPEAILNEADEIIISPGIALDHPDLQKINNEMNSDHRFIGDIELFAREARAPIVAITGSNGKSTVTTLVGEMAKNAGMNVGVGGNLGTPALELLQSENQITQAYILELSSFQLETTYSLKPKIATILNICPDHMDRYANFEAYADAKRRIYHKAENILYNRDDSLTQDSVATQPDNFENYSSKASSSNIRYLSFGLNEPLESNQYGLIKFENEIWLTKYQQKIMPQSKLALFGSHNVANALAALALGETIGIPLPMMIKTLETFKGLSHRCEWVAKYNNVVWINDSKGTNVGATVSALQGLVNDIPGKWILIAGGVSKSADFSPLKPIIKKSCRALVLLGEAAEELQNLFADTTPCFKVKNMQEAVDKSAELAKTGDGVLLSPACASLDMFKNYEERGEVFKKCVVMNAIACSNIPSDIASQCSATPDPLIRG